jgi:hypothetical protein
MKIRGGLSRRSLGRSARSPPGSSIGRKEVREFQNRTPGLSHGGRSRLAAADLDGYICWVTFRQCCWVTFRQRIFAHRYSVPLFWSRRPAAPGAKPPVDWHDLKRHAAVEKLSRPQPFVFNRILPQGRASIATRPSCRCKARRGVEGGDIIIFSRDFGRFSEPVLSV